MLPVLSAAQCPSGQVIAQEYASAAPWGGLRSSFGLLKQVECGRVDLLSANSPLELSNLGRVLWFARV